MASKEKLDVTRIAAPNVYIQLNDAAEEIFRQLADIETQTHHSTEVRGLQEYPYGIDYSVIKPRLQFNYGEFRKSGHEHLVTIRVGGVSRLGTLTTSGQLDSVVLVDKTSGVVSPILSLQLSEGLTTSSLSGTNNNASLDHVLETSRDDALSITEKLDEFALKSLITARELNNNPEICRMITELNRDYNLINLPTGYKEEMGIQTVEENKRISAIPFFYLFTGGAASIPAYYVYDYPILLSISGVSSMFCLAFSFPYFKNRNLQKAINSNASAIQDFVDGVNNKFIEESGKLQEAKVDSEAKKDEEGNYLITHRLTRSAANYKLTWTIPIASL